MSEPAPVDDGKVRVEDIKGELHDVAERAGFTAIGLVLSETWKRLGAIVDLAGGDPMEASSNRSYQNKGTNTANATACCTSSTGNST